MKKKRISLWQTGLCGIVLSGLVLPVHAGLFSKDDPAKTSDAASTPVAVVDPTAGKTVALLGTTSFSPIVKKVAPAVVTIFTTKNVKEAPAQMNPFANDPFFRQFFGNQNPGGEGQPGGPQAKVRKQKGLGSGVIVSTDGYIVTNFHVVGVADEIKVALGEDTKKEYDAKVIGKDEATDIALIKIDAKNLPVADLADSDKVEVGDIALAIGNPFGVGKTVTMGIVSAIGRDLSRIDGGNHLEDFIQTDASINPGNSGGPLVDLQGRMIGLNTAIVSGGGGNVGIGFAIPSNIVATVRDSLLKQGHVTRGFLGVETNELTPEVAKKLSIEDRSGVIVASISPNSAAEEAKIVPGDVIVEFDGRKVSDFRSLRLAVTGTPPGKKVSMKVLRDGKEKSLTVVLKEQKPTASNDRPDNGGGSDAAPAATQKFFAGVEIDDFDDDARRNFSAIHYPDTIKNGAIVVSVADDSPAAPSDGKQGLVPGDVILQVEKKDVRSAREAIEAAKSAKGSKDGVLLRVWSRGIPKYLVLKAGDQ
ncbi:serine protease Do [Verrucomicrobium sp. GAS474]|uniref:Do family serine endopeptidase n=1 Tax=Verrucomicrobium sp. GAS474 TaxID=1882831 RepID=UPI000879BBDB|nr:Do family serine endopeptidase [Verrucomicrobium sp. GAS474]SDT85984.1 serine protease Do [Verrucomicrobium sp. GAS474]